MLTFTLPLLPIVALRRWIILEWGENIGTVSLFAETLLLTPFVYAATVMIVSDRCVGVKPSALRAYRRVFLDSGWRVFLANLISTLIVFAGLALLVVPGLVLLAWYLLVVPVVVLEKRRAWTSLERSRSLSKGFYLRNFAIFFLMFVVVLALNGLVDATTYFLIPDQHYELLFHLGMGLVEVLATPLVTICLVLVYYDMRVRKEAFDLEVLGQDLRR